MAEYKREMRSGNSKYDIMAREQAAAKRKKRTKPRKVKKNIQPISLPKRPTKPKKVKRKIIGPGVPLDESIYSNNIDTNPRTMFQWHKENLSPSVRPIPRAPKQDWSKTGYLDHDELVRLGII